MMRAAPPVKYDASKVREQGVDAMRFIMALTVVILHALPEQNEAGSIDAMSYIAMMCRGAVPFFFIAAGYFLHPIRKDPARIVLDPLLRLAPIFLFWMIIYFLTSSIIPSHHWSWDLRGLISGGAAFHLWFLPALGAGMLIVSFGVKYADNWFLGFIFFLIYLIPVTYNAYYDVLLPPGAATRGGFFAAPLFIWMGYFVRVKRVEATNKFSLFMLFGSFLLLFIEEIIIARLSGKSIRSHDFALATFPLGVYVFLLSRSLQPTLIVSKLSFLGRYSLGIYVSHLLFIWILRPFIPVGVIGVFLLSLLAGCLALGLTLLMKRIPALKAVV